MTISQAQQIHEIADDPLTAMDYCYAQGWTDGLPVIPPEESRVQAMLAMEGRPPETVLAHHPATRLELTVHAAAANAVMAGCLPEYFPIIVAAFEAMDREPFNFHGSTVST
ncbi:MAG: UGSC family (seleno)protein, partial [Pseudomonadales bacterium]|nr:UGSC family (seleno)protein [Pseudomonadales bacterium]